MFQTEDRQESDPFAPSADSLFQPDPDPDPSLEGRPEPEEPKRLERVEAPEVPGEESLPATLPELDRENPQPSLHPEVSIEVSEPEPEPEPEPVDFPQGEILAIVNQKGGVGKTTTTINLGAALAEKGAKVLLVDLDSQGALSVGLGISDPKSLPLTVYNVLMDSSSTRLDEVIQTTPVEGLDLLPSNIHLSAAEMLMVQEVAREQLLQAALEPARATYNYILIDCPPSLGLLTVNALTAAHGVVVPLECEYFALRGMVLLMDTIEKVQARLNPDLEIKGIVATMLDSRTIHGNEVLSRVGDAYGDKLFKTVIHKTIRFAEAPVAGLPMTVYAPRSKGTQEYRDLAREVMSR